MRTSGELALLVALLCAAQEPPPARLDPAAYAARDAHEGVTLAAKPYLAEAEVEPRFGAYRLLAAGIVPIEVLLVNARAEPIRVAWERAVLLSGEEKFEQIEPERAAASLYPPPKAKSGRPWPEKRGKSPPPDKNRPARETLEAALRSQAIRAQVVPAGGRVRGFLYFFRGQQPLVLPQARLYVPEVVRLPGEEPLLFFEVEFKAYREP